MNKTNFIKDLNKVLKFDEPTRIVKRYGFCGGESIGYLRYLKKKFNFKSNPKIINFIHTPATNWSIYDTRYNNSNNDSEILINYPGAEINIDLPFYEDEFYKLKKNNYYLRVSSKETIELIISDKTIGNLNIEFFSLDNFKNKKKIYNLNIEKSKNNKFLIENFGNKLNFGKKKYFS